MLGRCFKDEAAAQFALEQLRAGKMATHDVRITITIPFPSYIPRARGIHAVGKFGTLFKAKCTVEEKDLVQQAADAIGITPTELIRWCAVQSAKEILNVPHS